MGLLDDAIREHLDLKRRSGGDPAEIERLEREALGPVRRDPTGAAPTATSYEEPPTEYLPEHGDDEANAEVPRAEIVGSVPEAPPKRRGFLHRRQAAPSEPDSGVERPEHSSLESDSSEPPAESAVTPSDREDEPEPPHLSLAGGHDEPASSVSPMDEPTVEHQVPHDTEDSEDEADQPTDADDRPAEAEAADQEDDVLEETPEFLQDTPEHDRLWFEQRPPKDFDFDG